MSLMRLYPARSLAEQFEVLKCRISSILARQHPGPFVIAFTSCEAHEGVTNVAVNFAAALVNDRRGHVLLVDGNLNNPGLHRYFKRNGNMRNEQLQVESPHKDVEVLDWQILQANPNLDVILARNVPEQQSRIFKITEFGNFLRCAKEKYAYVVIDCPPLNRASGAAVLSSKADAVVLVVEAAKVRREVVQRSINLLEDLGGNLIGVVLNKRKYPIPQFIYNML